MYYKYMNKHSADFLNWMHEYLNGKYANRFMHGFMDPIEIVRGIDIKNDIDRIKTVNHNSMPLNPKAKDDDTKSMMNFIHNNDKIINLYHDQLKSAQKADLIVHSTHADTINQEVCHVINNMDMQKFGGKLNTFLHRLPMPYKIKWILKNKKLSDNKFAKEVNMHQQQISLFKDGKRNIMNMTLKNAVNICDYYNAAIDQKLPIEQ